MSKKTYSEKLKDPRWQKKRLEILDRDNWTCQSCFDTESTLHVHHLEYRQGNDPWDYTNNLLCTLCESCHAFEHEAKENTLQLLSNEFNNKKMFSNEIFLLVDSMRGSQGTFVSERLSNVLCFLFDHPQAMEHVENIYFDWLEFRNKNRREVRDGEAVH